MNYIVFFNKFIRDWSESIHFPERHVARYIRLVWELIVGNVETIQLHGWGDLSSHIQKPYTYYTMCQNGEYFSGQEGKDLPCSSAYIGDLSVRRDRNFGVNCVAVMEIV